MLVGSVITVEWPFPVMVPAAASSLVAVLSWLVIYFLIWRLSLDVPQLGARTVRTCRVGCARPVRSRGPMAQDLWRRAFAWKVFAALHAFISVSGFPGVLGRHWLMEACMMKLSRCVLLVAVFVFTPRMCRAFSLYNAMAEIRELVICIFFTEKQAHESCDLWTVEGC